MPWLSGLVFRIVGRRLLGALLRSCGHNFFVSARKGFHRQLSTGRSRQSSLKGLTRLGGTIQFQQHLSQKLISGLLNVGRTELQRHRSEEHTSELQSPYVISY